MKKFYFLIILPAILLTACNNGPKKYTAEEMAAESKKANGYFDQWFKESVERSPEYQSYLGYKYDYDKWTNRSDAFGQTELNISKENLKLLKEGNN